MANLTGLAGNHNRHRVVERKSGQWSRMLTVLIPIPRRRLRPTRTRK